MITSIEKKVLLAHLMRRAGFGSNYNQLEELSNFEYDEVVDQLLNPEFGSLEDQDLLDRYFIEIKKYVFHLHFFQIYLSLKYSQNSDDIPREIISQWR